MFLKGRPRNGEVIGEGSGQSKKTTNQREKTNRKDESQKRDWGRLLSVVSFPLFVCLNVFSWTCLLVSLRGTFRILSFSLSLFLSSSLSLFLFFSLSLFLPISVSVSTLAILISLLRCILADSLQTCCLFMSV